MKRDDFILVIDSGNGGIFTLKHLINFMPNENYIYFKDEKHCPYGNKTKKQLLNIATNNLDVLIKKYPVKVVVFACNTLSTSVLLNVKHMYKNLMFFGVVPQVEQAVKNNKSTLVLSTKATLKIGEINSQYKNNKSVNFVSFKNLAKKIDKNINNLDNLQYFLNKKLKKYKNYNNVVLGCTHYNLIKKQLQNALNSNVDFYENSLNVANQIKKTMLKFNINSISKSVGRIVFICN